MKQTAVDYLQDEILKDRMVNAKSIKEWNDVIDKARKMEKQQIEDAHIEGQRVFDKYPHTQWTNDQAEQYYNETYREQLKLRQ